MFPSKCLFRADPEQIQPCRIAHKREMMVPWSHTLFSLFLSFLLLKISWWQSSYCGARSQTRPWCTPDVCLARLHLRCCKRLQTSSHRQAQRTRKARASKTKSKILPTSSLRLCCMDPRRSRRKKAKRIQRCWQEANTCTSCKVRGSCFSS